MTIPPSASQKPAMYCSMSSSLPQCACKSSTGPGSVVLSVLSGTESAFTSAVDWACTRADTVLHQSTKVYRCALCAAYLILACKTSLRHRTQAKCSLGRSLNCSNRCNKTFGIQTQKQSGLTWKSLSLSLGVVLLGSWFSCRFCPKKDKSRAQLASSSKAANLFSLTCSTTHK